MNEQCNLSNCRNSELRAWEVWKGMAGLRVIGYCSMEHAKQGSDPMTVLLTAEVEEALAYVVEEAL